MTPDEAAGPEEQFTAWLIACDEALKAGAAPDPPPGAGIAPEVRERLERGLAGLQLLRQFQAAGADTGSLAVPPWVSQVQGAAAGADTTATGPAAPASLPWARLGHYEVRRLLGSGGFGMVFQGYDPVLHRDVALKVPRAETLVTPELRERFQREARAAAHLDHPNLVPVYEAGEEGPVSFLVSAYCPGPTLAAWLRARAEPVPFREAAQLVAVLAEAVQYAHDRGVLHRDLKPANILLSPKPEARNPKPETREVGISDFGLRISDFEPKVTDFGLAKNLGTGAGTVAPTLTPTGAVLGTPSYMAPEQAGGKSTDTGPAADVYALGAILYELLTGRPPFQGESDLDILLQVQSAEPVAPARLRPKVPRDLETICLKCLQKEPGWRYAGAGALADDLRRYLRGEPVRARRVGRAERLWRWCRRNPALAAAVTCGLVALAAAGVFAYRNHLSEQQRQADQQSHQERLLTEQRQSALEKAMLVAMGGDLDQAEKAIRAAERLGASTGQVRMLRGLVAYHQGHVKEAAAHLEQAVELLPRSVAARSMLVMAYNHLGRWEQYERLLADIERLPPATPEDELFKALGEATTDPGGSLKALDKAIRKHPSTLVRLMRAQVRFARAHQTGDPADIEAALEDARAARLTLPGNPVALEVSLYAHLVAARAYEHRGDRPKWQAALDQAAREAKALKRFAALPEAVIARFFYFQCTGQEERVLKDLHRLSERTEHAPIAFFYMLLLYERREFGKALVIAEKRRGTYLVDFLRPFVLVEMPGGPRRAWKAYKDLEARYPRGTFPLINQMVLRFLGRKAEAVAVARQCRKHTDQMPAVHRKLFEGLLDYSCDSISAGQLLQNVATDKLILCYAHHLVGLTKLAEGDRAGARKHFRQAIATRAFLGFLYQHSLVFLARMKQDHTWPPWIRRRK
jgi:serine/threonine protein kinase